MPRFKPSTTAIAQRTATIRDVASVAGVSVATVSRVHNSTGRVSKQTAEAVLAVSRQLGFRPNLIGRNLRATRTRTIGVVLPSLNHPVFAECLQGIEAAAQANDHVIAISTTGYQVASEERVSERLLQLLRHTKKRQIHNLNRKKLKRPSLNNDGRFYDCYKSKINQLILSRLIRFWNGFLNKLTQVLITCFKIFFTQVHHMTTAITFPAHAVF